MQKRRIINIQISKKFLYIINFLASLSAGCGLIRFTMPVWSHGLQGSWMMELLLYLAIIMSPFDVFWIINSTAMMINSLDSGLRSKIQNFFQRKVQNIQQHIPRFRFRLK